jgi:hypothetical protein
MHGDLNSAILVFILGAILRGNMLLGQLKSAHQAQGRRITDLERDSKHHRSWLVRIAPEKEPAR